MVWKKTYFILLFTFACSSADRSIFYASLYADKNRCDKAFQHLKKAYYKNPVELNDAQNVFTKCPEETRLIQKRFVQIKEYLAANQSLRESWIHRRVEKRNILNSENIRLKMAPKDVFNILDEPSFVSALDGKIVWNYELLDKAELGAVERQRVPFVVAFKDEKVTDFYIKREVYQQRLERQTNTKMKKKDLIEKKKTQLHLWEDYDLYNKYRSILNTEGPEIKFLKSSDKIDIESFGKV